jgi:LacI family transcriptional regulator
MVKRPTIADLARAAGVSIATVDRVLNGRLPVREDTTRRVYEAATEIGFHAADLIGRRLHRDLPELRLGFLLLRPDDPFYRAFAAELQATVSRSHRFRGTAVIDFAETLSLDEIVEKLRRLAARSRAVAVVSPDHPTLTRAVEELKRRGIPVFALLSDFAAGVRAGYVGIDNLKVGRTAAWMIANSAKRPGKVALFVGSHRFHGHELREIGFRAFFREHAPDFTVMETLVNQESHRLAHDALVELLRRHDDLAGCYIAGGGAEGGISALREVRPAHRPIMICNEITADRRVALAEGLLTMVIDTPLGPLCSELVELMAHAPEGGAAGTQGQTFVPFGVYLPESV